MTAERFSEDAVMVIDVLKDFCVGGRLVVPYGDLVVDPINRVTVVARQTGRSVFFIREKHPLNSEHFIDNGGEWPVHCVDGTTGAELHDQLIVAPQDEEFFKGMRGDGFSAFEGFDAKNRPFIRRLKSRGIRKLYAGGLATDYCVDRSVEDALMNGFEVVVLSDGIRAVNRKPEDGREAIKRMKALGAVFKPSEQVVSEWLERWAA